MRGLDRWVGATLVALGFGVAGTARGYTVGFLVDPLGPRALPYLVAALLALGGGVMAFRRTAGRGPFPGGEVLPRAGAPEGPEAILRARGGLARSLLAQSACVGVLLLYVGAIPPFGFFLPTVLAGGALSRLFGGRWLPGLGVGLVLGAGLYGLFTWGFGLQLPVGALFQADS